METEASSGRDTSFLKNFLRVLTGRELRELREERRRFLDDKNALLAELRSVVDEANRVTTALRETADEAVNEIKKAVEEIQQETDSAPSMGERLSHELLQHWKQERNWNTSAIMSLEALAVNGKTDLAQWAAAELRNGGTISLGRDAKKRLILLSEGKVTPRRRGKTVSPSNGRTPPASAGGGNGTGLTHGQPPALDFSSNPSGPEPVNPAVLPESSNGVTAPSPEHGESPAPAVEARPPQ